MASLTALPLLLVVGCQMQPGADLAAATDYREMSASFDELQRQRLEVLVTCLDEQGFPGTQINRDGTTTHQLTPEQNERFDQAASHCYALSCPTCAEPPTEQDWTRLYALEVAARGCLVDHGLQVDDPPTLEVYLATPSEARWSAYRAARTQLVGPGSEEIRQACPDPGDFITYFGSTL